MKHGMHKMPNGKMMSEKEMKKNMKKMGKKMKGLSLRDMPVKY